MLGENACLSRGGSTRLWRSGTRGGRELGCLTYFVEKVGRRWIQIQRIPHLCLDVCYPCRWRCRPWDCRKICLLHYCTGTATSFLFKHFFIAYLSFRISVTDPWQFFFNFGPNATTSIIPAEVFPSRVRGLGHGVSAAVGKLGAILS